MAFNLSANPDEIRAAGVATVNNASTYIDCVKRLYAEVDSLRANWDGADNQQFANTVYGYKENIDALGQVIGNYGTFLQETANSLAKLQADIAQQAVNL